MALSIHDTTGHVCVSATIARPPTMETNRDEFTVEVSVFIGAKLMDKKSFQKSRQSFLSATEAEQRDMIITTTLQTVEIQFPSENIHWGTDFLKWRSDEKVEEIEAQILKVARLCAEDDQKGDMILHIKKLVKSGNNRKGPLYDWTEENEKDVNLHLYMSFINKLGKISPKENKYFGLRSVTVTEDSTKNCEICNKELKRGSQGISMRCSHVFHGYCILKRIAMNPSCPLCRIELFPQDTVIWD